MIERGQDSGSQEVSGALGSPFLLTPSPPKSGRGSILQKQVTPSVVGSGSIQGSPPLLSPVLSCRRCTSSTTTPILRTRTWLRSG